MQGKRRWLGLRVWVTDADGKRHNGTLRWEDKSSVLIRQDGVVGLQVCSRKRRKESVGGLRKTATRCDGGCWERYQSSVQIARDALRNVSKGDRTTREGGRPQ
jgi:hypothetical protein